MTDFFRAELDRHVDAIRRSIDTHSGVLETIVQVVVAAFRRGDKVMFCGNGGSAADSQHMAAEFVNRFAFDRAPLPSLALTVDGSVLTSIGNDSRFEYIFERQVQALGRSGDVLIGITTSGKSANVLAALKAARKGGIVAVAFTSTDGAPLITSHCDHVFAAESSETARIQEVHEFALHAMAERVERLMFGQVDTS